MIGREESRLAVILRRALLVALSTQASCSSDSATSAADDAGGGGTDATTLDGGGGNDGTTSSNDGSSDDGSNPTDGGKKDTGGPSCDPVPFDGSAYYDGGLGDAAPGCCGTDPDSGAPICDTYRSYACGSDTVLLPDGGKPLYGTAGCNWYLADCYNICGGTVFDCHVANDACVDAGSSQSITPGVPLIFECARCKGIGRRPEGLCEPSGRRGPNALGDYFARAAHLEAASVHAFRALRRELVRHRAPRRLVKMSERSARDEIRHARVTSRIARAHGGTPPAVEIAAPAQARSLEEIARENAVEGCVRETFGALVAAWQAEQAGDLAVRRVMKTVARDEARHAAFSWALSRWAEGRLSRAARARVRQARQATVEALRVEIEEKVAPDLVASAGLPPPEVARAMLDELTRSLFT